MLSWQELFLFYRKVFMFERNSTDRARRLAIRVLAVVFLALGVQWTASLALPLAAPAYLAVSFTPLEEGPLMRPDPIEVLPADARARVEAAPGGTERFAQRIADPAIRWPLFLVELLARLPGIATFLCVGIALWQFSAAPIAQALGGMPWLVRACACGLAMVLISPIADGLRTGLLLDGVTRTAFLDLCVELGTLQMNLLFAAAALVAAWSIEAGLRARAELAEIV